MPQSPIQDVVEALTTTNDPAVGVAILGAFLIYGVIKFLFHRRLINKIFDNLHVLAKVGLTGLFILGLLYTASILEDILAFLIGTIGASLVLVVVIIILNIQMKEAEIPPSRAPRGAEH